MNKVTWEMIIAALLIVLISGLLTAFIGPFDNSSRDYDYLYTIEDGDFR